MSEVLRKDEVTAIVSPISDRDLLGHNRCLMWQAYLDAVAEHRSEDARTIWSIWFKDGGGLFKGYVVTRVRSKRGGALQVELEPVDKGGA